MFEYYIKKTLTLVHNTDRFYVMYALPIISDKWITTCHSLQEAEKFMRAATIENVEVARREQKQQARTTLDGN